MLRHVSIFVISSLGSLTSDRQAYIKRRLIDEQSNPLALELEFSTPFMYVYNVNILWTKKGNIRKYTTFCGGINEDGESRKRIIKYIVD